MNALGVIMFLAFITGAMTINFIKDKYEPKNPPAIEQIQPAPVDGNTASPNK